jgi:hypothetical protein
LPPILRPAFPLPSLFPSNTLLRSVLPLQIQLLSWYLRLLSVFRSSHFMLTGLLLSFRLCHRYSLIFSLVSFLWLAVYQ